MFTNMSWCAAGLCWEPVSGKHGPLRDYMLNDRKRKKSLKRSADDVLLYDGPGGLVHRTDLHADALQGVVGTLPRD